MRTILFVITTMLLSVMIISCSDDEKEKEPEVATVILRVDSTRTVFAIENKNDTLFNYTVRELMSSAKLLSDGEDFQTKYIYGFEEIYQPGYIYVIKAERKHVLWPKDAVCVDGWQPYNYTLLEVVSKSKQ